jgi:cobalt-zinc-cadmium efflux system protein
LAALKTTPTHEYHRRTPARDHSHSHDGGHNHGHGHGHGHDHTTRAPADAGPAGAGRHAQPHLCRRGACYGFIANSVALIADAGHNLSDVLGLAATLVATILALRPASGRFTYGMRRASVLAALGNAVLLLFTSGAIAWEAVQRSA